MMVKLYLCGGELSKLDCEYPLSLGCLKANYSGKHSIEIVNNSKLLIDCDLIGLSSNAWGAREAIDILNSTDIPVIIGGQITLWYQLRSYDFKHIVLGEGETTFNGILNNDVDGKAVYSSPIQDIDTIKFPDRGKMKKNEAMIMTSRGCPFNCNFCSSQKFWGKVRYNSAEYFIDEVKHLIAKYPQIKKLNIADDLFASHKKRLREIHSLWMKNKLNRRLILPRGFIRSNIFDEEICILMKEMGFRTVRFGGESASNRILKLLNKEATVEDHERTIGICRKHNVNVSASFMFDIPGETEEDKAITKDFIKKYKGILGNGGRYKFQAFPGTKFYNGEDLYETDMRVRP